MADTVQYFLEEMVPELQQLLKRGIFSESEVRMIAKERRGHEYRLKSKNVQLADFLRYIEYETNLNKLRKVRLRMKNVTKRSELAKFSGVKRIHFLYIRALKRFHQHIPLWQQHIRFCVSSGSSKSLNKTFARVLQLHPLEQTFWVQAAFWEYRHNQNVLAARSLLQRAIRTIPNCQWTWLEYARLELLYWKKIKDRLALMGIEAAALVPKKDKAVQVPEEEEGEVEQEETDKESLSPESPFMKGMIPRIVFDRAISKYGGSFEYYMEFLSLFEEFPETEELQQHVLDAIARDFPRNADCQAFLAKRPLLGLGYEYNGSEEQEEALSQADENFNNAEQHTASPELFVEHGRVYATLAARATTGMLAKELLQKEVAIYEAAHQQGALSEDLALAWIAALMASFDMEGAANVAKKATKLLARSSRVWEQAIRAQVWLASEDGVGQDDALALLSAAVAAVPQNECNDLWALFVEVCASAGVAWSTVLDSFRRVLMSGSKDLADIKTKFLRTAHVAYGLDAARQVYEMACKFPPVGLPFYLEMIALEQSCRRLDDDRLGSLFQRATSDRDCTQSLELWLAYARYGERLGKLYDVQWKARKALRDPSLFDSHFA